MQRTWLAATALFAAASATLFNRPAHASEATLAIIPSSTYSFLNWQNRVTISDEGSKWYTAKLYSLKSGTTEGARLLTFNANPDGSAVDYPGATRYFSDNHQLVDTPGTYECWIIDSGTSPSGGYYPPYISWSVSTNHVTVILFETGQYAISGNVY